MHKYEILTIVTGVTIILALLTWVLLSRLRHRRAEQPRLRLAELRLPVDDWRVMVPSEWQTEETERLFE